jgi:polar amino acid transport system ATP-binding protein
MDEGIIFEDGPPEQIFDSPRQEKTRAFIRNIKTFTFAIRTKTFDLYRLNAGIEEFCRRQFIGQKETYSIQLVIEELVMQKLLPRQTDAVSITITVGYSEKTGEIELTLDYPGGPYNPLEDGGPDDLPLVLVRNVVRGGECRCEEGANRLRLTL